MNRIFAVIVTGIALAVTACGDDSPTSPSAQDGRFTLRLSASSYSSAPAVLATFGRVRAQHASRGLQDVPLPNGASQLTCDLRKLQTSEGEAAAGFLPPGEYSEVRLLIQSVTLFLDNPAASVCAASIPAPAGRSVTVAGTPTDVVLSRSFRIETGADTVMRVGVNSEQSIRATGSGSYTLQPQLTVLSVN